MTTITRTRMTGGAFATGLREIEIVSEDTSIKFRGFVVKVAEDLGMSDDEVDEQLSLLLNIRLEARRRREVCPVPVRPR